jgi:hypothetical protein
MTEAEVAGNGAHEVALLVRDLECGAEAPVLGVDGAQVDGR